MKEKLLTCGKFKSDCLNKTKSQTSTFELKTPQVIIKSKSSSNPVYQGSASEMILIQFSHSQSVIRERKRGEDWERIWKRFGDAKLNSQELEKQGEINLPKECLKGFV